jgi:hypothetical protein
VIFRDRKCVPAKKKMSAHKASPQKYFWSFERFLSIFKRDSPDFAKVPSLRKNEDKKVITSDTFSLSLKPSEFITKRLATQSARL